MNPLVIFCGEKSKPACAASTPLSNFGLSFFNAKPLASPSVPGKESPPAPLDHVASPALSVKLRATLVVGVPFTLISTHQDLLALTPIPNRAPAAFLNFQ